MYNLSKCIKLADSRPYTFRQVSLYHFLLLLLGLLHMARFFIELFANLLLLLGLLHRARFFIEPFAHLLIPHPLKRSLRFPLWEGFEVEVLSAVL